MDSAGRLSFRSFSNWGYLQCADYQATIPTNRLLTDISYKTILSLRDMSCSYTTSTQRTNNWPTKPTKQPINQTKLQPQKPSNIHWEKARNKQTPTNMNKKKTINQLNRTKTIIKQKPMNNDQTNQVISGSKSPDFWRSWSSLHKSHLSGWHKVVPTSYKWRVISPL